MFTSLDWLVIVFWALVVVGLLAMGLMFFVRKPLVQNVCFFVAAALGIYLGSVGIRIGGSSFPTQTAVGVLVVIVSIVAVALCVWAKSDEKKLRYARLLVSAALILGILNAFIL